MSNPVVPTTSIFKDDILKGKVAFVTGKEDFVRISDGSSRGLYSVLYPPTIALTNSFPSQLDTVDYFRRWFGYLQRHGRGNGPPWCQGDHCWQNVRI